MLCNIKQGNVLWLGFVEYGILRIQLRKTPPAAIVSKQLELEFLKTLWGLGTD